MSAEPIKLPGWRLGWVTPGPLKVLRRGVRMSGIVPGPLQNYV